MDQKKFLTDFVSKEAKADLFAWSIINKFYDCVYASLGDLASIPLDSFNCEYPELVREAGKILSDFQKLSNATQVALMLKRQSIYDKYLNFEVNK